MSNRTSHLTQAEDTIADMEEQIVSVYFWGICPNVARICQFFVKGTMN
jgi:hypothetical protein